MAVIEENDAQSALTQLRAYLAQQQRPVNSRLPTERELCRALGVTRTAVRKALATLEAEGQLWRHVGKGTFVGTRPIEDLTDMTDRYPMDVGQDGTSPRVMKMNVANLYDFILSEGIHSAN
jgi:DNA-binding GntR family transcriptional regulator